jgi:hypothetical protein
VEGHGWVYEVEDEDGMVMGVWHSERHVCPRCGKYQELTPLVACDMEGIRVDGFEEDGELTGALGSFVEELRKNGVERVVAVFHCGACRLMSVCGYQTSGEPGTVHLGYG